MENTVQSSSGDNPDIVKIAGLDLDKLQIKPKKLIDKSEIDQSINIDEEGLYNLIKFFEMSVKMEQTINDRKTKKQHH